jgi:hypothetical protein
MASENIDLYIEQNADFYQNFVIQNQDETAFDVTGYSFKAQIRVIPDDTIIAEFDVTIEDAASGTLYLFIPAATTLTMPVNDQFNPYRYDVLVSDTNGNQFIIFHGKVYVIDSITRL